MKENEFKQLLNGPLPIVLTSSRAKGLHLLLGSMILVALSVFALSKGVPLWIGWLGIVFFGFCGVTAVLILFTPRLNALTLETHGFTLVGLRKKTVVAWNKVSVFEVKPIPMNKTQKTAVYYDDGSTTRLAQINRELTGSSAMLPLTYDVTETQLAKLMNHWRDKALKP